MAYNLVIYISILIAAFYLLLKSANYLIISSSVIGERVGISKFVIGLTLIAIGTSLPEFFTSLFGVLDSPNNAASFVLGTVIGSNIANILLVFSILLLFSKNFKSKVKNFDLIFLLLVSFSLLFIIYSEQLNLIYGIIYLILFGIYLYASVKLGFKKEFENIDELEEVNKFHNYKIYVLILIFFSALFGLNIAAKTVVYAISNLGKLLLIPISFLTFTTVAFATSLPEMVVSYSSAKKKEFDIAVGNIIGSNISNILFILGSIGIFSKLSFNHINYLLSIYMMLFVTIVFSIILIFKKIKFSKMIGILLLLIYFVYIYFLF